MKKITVDILLFILMILEFSKNYMPSVYHEIIGIILIVLIIIHLILNKNYIKNIPKGKYNLKRTVMLLINIVFVISFSLSLPFGVLSSKELLPFLNIGNMNITHSHKIFAYITIICMAMHLGINTTNLINKIEKKLNKSIFYILIIIIISLGIYSWINLDIWNHLIGKYGFSMITGNIITNTLKYLSIVISITIITNIIYKKIK